MPTYTLIRVFEDGSEEESEFTAPAGSGIEVGRHLLLDGEDWRITNIRPFDPPTIIVER